MGTRPTNRIRVPFVDMSEDAIFVKRQTQGIALNTRGACE